MKKAKKQSKDSLHNARLPAGYKILPLSEFSKAHVFTTDTPIVEGTLVEVKKVKSKFGKHQIMGVIQKENGVTVSVWETRALQGLFDKENIGKDIYIRFDGELKLPGRKKAMKQFTVGVKE